MFKKLLVLLFLVSICSSCTNRPTGLDLYFNKVTKVVIAYAGKPVCIGSTFPVKYKGYIYYVTSAHVCENYNYDVVLPQYGYKTKPGYIGSQDTDDICIFTGPYPNGYFEMSDTLELNSKATIIGYPMDIGKTSSDVVLTNLDSISLIFKGIAYPGNSGGPVINSRGKIIGVVEAISENEPLVMAVPDKYLIYAIESFISGKK